MNKPNRIKSALRGAMKKLPHEGRSIFETYWQMKALKQQLRHKLSAARVKTLPNPKTIYWIKPDRIAIDSKYKLDSSYLLNEDHTFIPTYDEFDTIKAIEQRIESKAESENIKLYSEILSRLREPREQYWNNRSEINFIEIQKYIDLLAKENFDQNTCSSEEIVVNIDSDGRYILKNGRLRFLIAKALKVPLIPAVVYTRHDKWIAFREQLRTTGLYQNPIHPDLQDIPYAHGCEDRFNAIKAHLPEEVGAVLDVGTNIGYFCHKLEDLGFECFAVETLPTISNVAECLRIAEGKRFTIITNDIFLAMREPSLQRSYKIILALNILHHFLKTPDTFKSLQQWLKILNLDQMFFEPHCPNESQMIGAHINFNESDFVQFILRHSELNHFELIHRCDDGRPVFRLWR